LDIYRCWKEQQRPPIFDVGLDLRKWGDFYSPGRLTATALDVSDPDGNNFSLLQPPEK
jgi:hypothetical protein